MSLLSLKSLSLKPTLPNQPHEIPTPENHSFILAVSLTAAVALRIQWDYHAEKPSPTGLVGVLITVFSEELLAAVDLVRRVPCDTGRDAYNFLTATSWKRLREH